MKSRKRLSEIIVEVAEPHGWELSRNMIVVLQKLFLRNEHPLLIAYHLNRFRFISKPGTNAETDLKIVRHITHRIATNWRN